MAVKNPFDSIEEPERPDSSNKRREHPGILICEACGARIKAYQHGKHIVRTAIDKAIKDHVCEQEVFPYYDFNDPRTLLEQRNAHINAQFGKDQQAFGRFDRETKRAAMPKA